MSVHKSSPHPLLEQRWSKDSVDNIFVVAEKARRVEIWQTVRNFTHPLFFQKRGEDPFFIFTFDALKRGDVFFEGYRQISNDCLLEQLACNGGIKMQEA